MAQFIDHGHNGLLVPHRNPASIAAALNNLLDKPEPFERLGRAACSSHTEGFAPHAILPLQIAAHERAITNAHVRNSTAKYV